MKILATRYKDNDLDRFVGKDIWVRVHEFGASHSHGEYIQILSKSGDYYTYRRIMGNIVDHSPDGKYHCRQSDYDYIFSPDHIYQASCRQFSLYFPFSAYTTDELFVIDRPEIDEEYVDDEEDW